MLIVYDILVFLKMLIHSIIKYRGNHRNHPSKSRAKTCECRWLKPFPGHLRTFFPQLFFIPVGFQAGVWAWSEWHCQSQSWTFRALPEFNDSGTGELRIVRETSMYKWRYLLSNSQKCRASLHISRI